MVSKGISKIKEIIRVVHVTVSGENRSMVFRQPIVYKAQLTNAHTTRLPPSKGLEPNPSTAPRPEIIAIDFNDLPPARQAVRRDDLIPGYSPAMPKTEAAADVAATATAAETAPAEAPASH